MLSTAEKLAEWAVSYRPSHEDLALADRALVDTMAVALAARDDDLVMISQALTKGERWAAIAHVLDFDDLHMETTTHISTVCVPATLATDGNARSYLAGAGVMARIGIALGWQHYVDGWHITCTAGAPAAAVSASIAFGLNVEQTARAIALALPGAGGVQKAFGTQNKSLQIGFATGAGIRAAELAAAGATADPAALDQWITLMGGDPTRVDLSGPAIPGGLAIKMYPCCYALQRPISALSQFAGRWKIDDIETISIVTPQSAVQPLHHHDPQSGLEAKFSLEYAVATALLDQYPGFKEFEDAAVLRPDARALMQKVRTRHTPGGDWLLHGTFDAEVVLRDGARHSVSDEYPTGSPLNPPTSEQLMLKLDACGADVVEVLSGVSWSSAPSILKEVFRVAS